MDSIVINYVHPPVDVKRAVRDRRPIDDLLHVIMVISNPCQYQRRFQLMRECRRRLIADPEQRHIRLYTVELVYGATQEFAVTDSTHPRHLQLRTLEPAMWHKENMINIGIAKLLPADWKAVAWIDADIEFDSPTWVSDTLKILNDGGEGADIVQLFSHCVDMDAQQCTMNVFNSAGFQYTKRVPHGTGKHQWHPGYAWACTRTFYDRIGGIYELGILGSGDNIMMMSLIGHGLRAIPTDSTPGYQASVLKLQERMQGAKFGYVPGVIRHYYHGTKENRQYTARWKILSGHGYDPDTFVVRDADSHGLLVPVLGVFPPKLAIDIMEYFVARKEDDQYVADSDVIDVQPIVDEIPCPCPPESAVDASFDGVSSGVVFDPPAVPSAAVPSAVVVDPVQPGSPIVTISSCCIGWWWSK